MVIFQGHGIKKKIVVCFARKRRSHAQSMFRQNTVELVELRQMAYRKIVGADCGQPINFFSHAEVRDRYREDETVELREVKRELEATSKACRILQFKLRKTERRCDQLESERTDYEEKVRDNHPLHASTISSPTGS